MKKIFVLFLTLCSMQLVAQDKKGCDTTHPSYISRITGYDISSCEYSEYRDYTFIYYAGTPAKAYKLQQGGKFRQLFFTKNGKENRKMSADQIRTNYANAILKSKGKELSKNKTLFTFRVDNKEVYIELHTTNSADEKSYNIIILEVEAMKQEVEANINEAMEEEGKFALYGVFFDTGKSVIKPESETALNTVVEYLTANPAVKIVVVGHTDNTGGYDANTLLSKSRATSVKNWLITKGKIAATRLKAEGAGQFCPVATNKTEEGKAKNRRVEIVLL